MNPPQSAGNRAGVAMRWLCSAAVLLMLAATIVHGEVKASCEDDDLRLDNGQVTAQWSITAEGGLWLSRYMLGGVGGCETAYGAAFELSLDGDVVLSSRELKPAGKPVACDLPAEPGAAVYAKRLPGKAIEIRFAPKEGNVDLLWRGVLREGSRYIRQELVLTPRAEGIVVKKLTMIDAMPPDAMVAGAVRGSPAVSTGQFFAVEHPAAISTVADGHVLCTYSRLSPLPMGQSLTISSVIGAAEPGQIRRAFNEYLQRERAHPYRQFLHYNTWYHLNIGRPGFRMTEAEAIRAIADIGTELTAKRGVTLQSYVMDDGWDSPATVWGFNDNFPQGFANIAREAAKHNAGIGLWMSPFGGYGEPKAMRLANGKKAGFETNANGFSMAGKNYQAHFLKTALGMVRDYRVNFFKFDGMGGGNFADGGDSAYADDMDAMFNVILPAIRRERPDVYISATVGTWPSPFWLRYADSIWRQAADTGFAGVGNGRERWITYRDGMIYERVVKRGPLYPINALMNGGLVIGERENPAKMDRDETSVRHEIRSFFGGGTSLQELYISPHLLTPAMWDGIAESARWSKRNEDCLADVHWIGGDPKRLEVYGFASWAGRKGTVCLRNPSDKEQEFPLDIGKALELPFAAPEAWKLASPYKDQRIQRIEAKAGAAQSIRLAPFEVLTFDCRAAD